MHDAHFRETFGPQSGGSANLTTQRDAAFLYWNPCFGTPPIEIRSPRLFFGIQIAAGLVALLVLLIEPFRPTGQSVGLP